MQASLASRVRVLEGLRIRHELEIEALKLVGRVGAALGCSAWWCSGLLAPWAMRCCPSLGCSLLLVWWSSALLAPWAMHCTPG